MEFIPAPKVVQCELTFQVGTTVCENIFNVLCPQEPIAGDMQNIGNVLEAWYLTKYKVLQPQTVQYIRLHMRDMGSRVSIERDFVPLEAVYGSDIVYPILPMNVSVAINLHSAYAGRSARGRIYYVGLKESNVTGDGIDSTFLATVRSNFADLIGDFQAAGYTWVIVSRVADGLPRAQAVTYPVVSISTKGVVCSQKRRLSGRGN